MFSQRLLFLEWMKHFIKVAKPSAEEPVLFIMDNHESHINLESYELGKEKNVHIVSIPPHSSHRLQPLDLAFYGPLKKSFHAECDRFFRANRFQKIIVQDIASISTKHM